MTAKELTALLIEVISSWQVIVVTVVVFLYFYLVSYVARLYRRSSFSSIFPARTKRKKRKPVSAEPENAEGEEDTGSGDELGLEEG
jgi:hypothetical protein